MVSFEQFLTKDTAKFEKFLNADSAYNYVKSTGRRDPKAEKLIISFPRLAYMYARDIIKDRWFEAEPGIYDSTFWYNYMQFLKARFFSETKKLGWLKKHGVTRQSLVILNYIGMGEYVQEYIINKHPDWIDRIEHLDPKVKNRFKYDLDTRGIEI